MLLNKDKDDTYLQGQKAFEQGRDTKDCGHPLGSESRGVWFEGFYCAPEGADNTPEVPEWAGC